MALTPSSEGVGAHKAVRAVSPPNRVGHSPLNESPADLIKLFPANKRFHGTEHTDLLPLLSAGELFQGLLTLVSACSEGTMLLQDCIANFAIYGVSGLNLSLTDLSHNLLSAMLPECVASPSQQVLGRRVVRVVGLLNKENIGHPLSTSTQLDLFIL